MIHTNFFCTGHQPEEGRIATNSDKEDTNAVIKGSPKPGQRTKDLTSSGNPYATEQ
jgi:hypothetical protein